ncbi:thioredoxin domain-containing protein [Planococcus salinus]|uniref:Thioredoxin domain-containing protein n=1 Tax=Planococcus salinus TaxID=1848460 RepID=A0A3M8P4Y5_9BACL|nr:thioredoxin domain-containing protein [Planococcus salinus]
MVDARPSADKNWLSLEKSPYLLQHDSNPVNWYPWSDAAFKRAAAENKPVFLSIGYSTCHWCHVMEHESFEDAEVAELLNDHFIAIKVDREERPDIDTIYMNICQLLTGEGGWPLNVFLTPEQRPFYAGTYFPKTSKYGRPGMMDVLPQLLHAYRTDPEKIQDVADKLTGALQPGIQTNTQEVSSEVIAQAHAILEGEFDSSFGGFGGAPKFPSPGQLLFLLRYYAVTKDQNTMEMVEKTLDSIADGGIYDHVGFGFARYSTDPKWLVPHFEKMLYDQALMMMVYTEAFLINRNPSYRKIVYDTARFLKREMLHPDGGFYSAIDADSEGEEGKYYVWSADEITKILGTEQAPVYREVYNITPQGNFENANIPNLIGTNKAAIADKHGMTLVELERLLENCRQQLLAERQKRSYPHLDDKILTSWNGLCIAAMAKAGAAFAEPKFLELAENAVEFVDTHLWQEEYLYTRWREGEAKNLGYLDDYAHLLWAHIELYMATGAVANLAKAKQLAQALLERFEDIGQYGFFFTDKEAEALIVRDKTAIDGAMPSGNGIAALQLWRLGKLTGDNDLLTKSDTTITAFADIAEKYPSAVLMLLTARLAFQAGGKEIVISGTSQTEKSALLQFLRTSYRPYDVWLEATVEAAGTMPLTEGKIHDDIPLAVYVCENYVCKMPLFDLQEVKQRLAQ